MSMPWVVPVAFVAADTACKLCINADSYAFLRVSKELLEGDDVSNRSHDGACCPSMAMGGKGVAVSLKLDAKTADEVRLHLFNWF